MAAAPKRVLRVLGVMGSPHIKGNSDTLLDRALEGVTAAAAERGFECKVEKVVLATKQVTPCHYCAACHKSSPAGGPCPVKDDMVAIAEQFLAADIVLHSFRAFSPLSRTNRPRCTVVHHTHTSSLP